MDICKKLRYNTSIMLGDKSFIIVARSDLTIYWKETTFESLGLSRRDLNHLTNVFELRAFRYREAGITFKMTVRIHNQLEEIYLEEISADSFIDVFMNLQGFNIISFVN